MPRGVYDRSKSKRAGRLKGKPNRPDPLRLAGWHYHPAAACHCCVSKMKAIELSPMRCGTFPRQQPVVVTRPRDSDGFFVCLECARDAVRVLESRLARKGE